MMKLVGRLLLWGPLRTIERRFWDLHSRTWDDTLELEGGAERVDRVPRALLAHGLPAGSGVLDIGCGTGNHVLALSRAGYVATGLDFSPAMLDIAREKVEPAESEIDFVIGDFNERLPFDDGMFDAAISIFTFQRVADTPGFLKEVRRVLAPGGVLYLEAPSAYRLTPSGTGVTRRIFWRIKGQLNSMAPTFDLHGLSASATATGFDVLDARVIETSAILIARSRSETPQINGGRGKGSATSANDAASPREHSAFLQIDESAERPSVAEQRQ